MLFGSLFNKIFHKKSLLSDAEIDNLIADLLFGMLWVDGKAGTNEVDHLIKILATRSDIDESLLRQRSSHSKQINNKELEYIAQSLCDNLPSQERVQLLRNLWEIIMADGVADRYEEALFNRVAAMLGITGERFIKNCIKN